MVAFAAKHCLAIHPRDNLAMHQDRHLHCQNSGYSEAVLHFILNHLLAFEGNAQGSMNAGAISDV